MANIATKNFVFLDGLSKMFKNCNKIQLPFKQWTFLRTYSSDFKESNDSKLSDPNVIKQSPSSAEKLLQDSVVGKASDIDTLWESNPYKEYPVKRDQKRLAERPNVDPRDTSILLFPGQGSQFVGMGKDLLQFPIVQDMFEAANEVLGYDLLKLCLEGPKEKLDQTKYCQPAVMITSLGAVEKLKEERPQAIESCVAAAGFSVGELTALVFAGSLPFEQAVRLVKVRAEAMQLASEITPSGMATVLYGPDSQLGYACKEAKEHCIQHRIEKPECVVANYLYPHSKVIAGNEMALEFLEKNASRFKLRRIRRLPVSGAFHTELMRPAVEPFRTALKKCNVSEPLVSVHSNVDARRYRDAQHIKRQLPSQICKPVRWEQTLHTLFERNQGEAFPRTFECGPGRSLRTILKQVNAKAWDTSFSIEA